MYFSAASLLSALALVPAALALTNPSDDPFYKVPSNLKKYTPGDIIRKRPVPSTLAGNLAYRYAYQFLYRTTDNSGNPDATVATIIVPSTNADPTKLLSYQFAEDSAYFNCAPSYGIQSGANLEASFLPNIELLGVNAALQQGWYVVAPDYEGPHATFLANKGAGQRTLDGVRAALKSTDFSGVSKNARVALWGYSGGSLASGFAAELQPSYAPELTLSGVALGGTTPNILNVLYTVNKGLFAGLIPAGIAGLAQAYPQLNTYLQKTILPNKLAAFNQVKKECSLGYLLTYAFQDVFTYTKNPATAFTAPLPSSITKANNLGQGDPKVPLYVYKGTADEISPLNDTQLLVTQYCERGVSVDFVMYAGAEHLGLLVTGTPGTVSWLSQRFSGISQSGCTTSTTF